VRTTGLTYDDLLEMFPEETNQRVELIGGELIVTPSGTPRHQRAVVKIVGRLLAYEQERGGRVYPAPLDVWLTERDVLQPDVLFLLPGSLEKQEPALIRSAPDLAIEVSSPSTRQDDLGRKLDLYARHGVAEYWFVDLEAGRIEVRALQGSAYAEPETYGRSDTLRSRVLEGFTAAVDDLLGI